MMRTKLFSLLSMSICLSVAYGSTATVTIGGGEKSTASGVFDSGTVKVTVDGYSETVSYGKFSSTASVASAVAAKFSLDCQSSANAMASGSTISFQSRYPSESLKMTASVSWDTADFTVASFNISMPQTPPPTVPASTPVLACSPSTILAGESLTCSVELPPGAQSSVSFTANGALWATGTPDASSSTATVNAVLSQTAGAFQIAYSYPGDTLANQSIPASSGTAQVTVDTQGTVTSGNTIYSFSITDANQNAGYAPNGNINNYNDSVTGAWSLGYDNLNRLTSSQQAPLSTNPQYGCWAYDSFGNMLTQAMSNQAITGSGNSCQPQSGAITLQSNYQFSDGTNRITLGSWLDANKNTHAGSPQYDNAGNMIGDLLNTYLYDADGRVCAVQAGAGGPITGYLYDAEGNRVAKGTLTNMTCDPSALQITEAYFIGPGGETMTVIDGQGNWIRTEASAAGMQLATYTPTGIHYPITDWLGTKRVVVNPNMTLNNGVEETCASLPFGDGLNCSTSTDDTPRHFTGKERDTESGLDYMGARYYGSSMGRFMSPDPLGGHLENPQTLNRYVYAGNNPLSFSDPTGLDFYLQCETISSTCASKTVGYDKNGVAKTALVQGVTNSDKSFTATQIGNDANGGLVDKTTGTGSYSANVSGSGVQFSQDGGKTSVGGVFVNHDANPTSVDTNIQGSGALSGFNFTFTNSKMEASQTAAGTFTYNGSLDDARSAMGKAGFSYFPLCCNFGFDEYRSDGSRPDGANSGHFNIDRYKTIPINGVPQVTGNMHFGEHNPLFSPILHIFGEARQ